jgi:APA family basic amino acid/polyamine antiporter
VLPLAAIAGTIWLATDLGGKTWLRFGIWMVIGLLVYAIYSMNASRIGDARAG